jgi:hypothetical protein
LIEQSKKIASYYQRNRISSPSPPAGACQVPPLVLLTSATGVGSCNIVAMARCFVGTGCTHVLLAAAMLVCPTVIPGVRSLLRFPPFCRYCHWSSLCPSRIIHQFLVDGGEYTAGGHEGQICSRELLEDNRIIRCCKSQVVKSCL